MTDRTGRVALTGATGFLGLRLAAELLRRGERLLLLTRPGPPSAVERLIRHLASTGTPPTTLRDLTDRVREQPVDLLRPDLGLSRDEHRRLADRITTLWHCAADTSFVQTYDHAHALNTGGTRHLLRLLDHAANAPLLCHISTVGVTGARRSGTIREDDLDGSHGFHNAYERSKYEAELLVHDWHRATGRPVLIFRPSGLVTDRPGPHGAPLHLLSDLARRWHAFITALSATALVLRLDRPPGSTNLLPVEHAAYVMVEAARARRQATGVSTFHVVNSRNTPVSAVLDAVNEKYGLAVRLAVGPPTTAVERRIRSVFSPYLGWIAVDRTYDAAGMAGLGLADGPAQVIDHSYLLAAVGSGVQTS